MKYALVLLACMVLSGCSAGPKSAASFTSPSIRRNDPIRTYEEYRELLTKPDPVINALSRTVGQDHTRACITELSKLPSRPSRQYTQSLIDVLRSEGIAVPSLPPSPYPPEQISYAELAMVCKLTMSLIMPTEVEIDGKRVTPQQQFRSDLRYRLCMTIVATCPDDVSAVGAAFSPWMGQVQSDSPVAVRRLARSSIDAGLARYLDPEHRFNLTSLELFATRQDTTMGMVLWWYEQTLNASPREVHDLARGLRAAGERARRVDSSVHTQRMLDEYLASMDRLLADLPSAAGSRIGR